MRIFSLIKNTLLFILWPEFCCCCDKYGTLLCSTCYEELAFFTLPISLKLKDSLLDQVLAALELEGGARKLIHSLKYHNVKDAGRICAQIIFQSVLLPDFDLVTAVPLHRKRESQRGYNQAEVIARYLARFSNRPYIDAIKRTVFTAPQAKTIAKSERLKKLENAFSLNLPVSIIKGKTVLLVDDVATTGTTLNECAKILRQNGAKMVCAVVVAHGG